MKRKRTRPMRDMNPRNKHNWALVCSACGARFYDDEKISLTEGHFQEAHPDIDNPHFNLTWVGVGPAPKKPGG